MNEQMLDKLIRSYEVCNGDGSCEACPYGMDNCEDQNDDALEFLRDLKKHGAIIPKKIERGLFALRGRLEAAWSMERDSGLAYVLEDCVDDLNEIMDGLFADHKESGEDE